MEEKITKYLEHLESFISNEIPLVMKEHLNWNIYCGIFYGLVYLLPSVIILIICVRSTLYGPKEREDCEWATLMLGYILSFVLLIIATVNFHNAAYTYVAPRKVIYEKVNNDINRVIRNFGD